MRQSCHQFHFSRWHKKKQTQAMMREIIKSAKIRSIRSMNVFDTELVTPMTHSQSARAASSSKNKYLWKSQRRAWWHVNGVLHGYRPRALWRYSLNAWSHFHIHASHERRHLRCPSAVFGDDKTHVFVVCAHSMSAGIWGHFKGELQMIKEAKNGFSRDVESTEIFYFQRNKW